METSRVQNSEGWGMPLFCSYLIKKQIVLLLLFLFNSSPMNNFQTAASHEKKFSNIILEKKKISF